MDVQALRARVEADLSRLGSNGDVPGVSVAVASGADVVEATFGVLNSRTGVPVRADSLFQIQSITKVLTATLVMQLVDEGLVEIDEPIQAYLPEFHTADAAASRRITVRHLLTHTGGFEGDLWQPTTAGSDALDRFVRDLVSEAEQHSEPGRRFSYCNAGFGTLGRLVEVVRDTTYEQALRRGLAVPLGVEELAFSADQALAFGTAIGHLRPTPEDSLRPTREWALVPPSNPAAGNQLAMSARALLSLGSMFLARGQGPDGARLLRPETADLMLRPLLRHRGVVPTPTYQGLGWRLPRPGVAEHDGGMPGVASLLQIVPGRQVAAVVLTNADAGGRLARRLLDPLLTDLAGVEPPSPLPPHDKLGRVPDPEPLLGRYSTRQADFEVSLNDRGRLTLVAEPRHESASMMRLAGAAPSTERDELRHLDEDTYARVDEQGRATGTITFLDRGEDGRYRFLATDRVAPRRP